MLLGALVCVVSTAFIRPSALPTAPRPVRDARHRYTMPGIAGAGRVHCVTMEAANALAELDAAIDAFDEKGVAPVLGDPNYVSRVEEPRDVSPLYLKFADDMSRDVCRTMILNEYSPEPTESPVLTRFVDKDDLGDDEAIDENLRYLSLHFLGEHISAGDAAALAPLRGLFAAAIDFEAPVHQRAQEGWYATCVAMMASPSFHLY